MRIKLCAVTVFFLVLSFTVVSQVSVSLVTPENYLVDWNKSLTDAVVTDGFSPMLVSRSYLYPNIAAYEALRYGQKGFRSLSGQLSELDSLPQPDKEGKYYFDVAAITAFWVVSKEFIYREYVCDSVYARQIQFIRSNNDLDETIFRRSEAFGKTLGARIIKWSKKDRYNKTKAQPKYLISNIPGHWQPTPPEYRSALEPYWKIIRTCCLKDKNEFLRKFETPYSTEKGSPFYKMVYEVYDVSTHLTDEQKRIAKYWDDNPDQTIFPTQGHRMLPRRQMSPTAHWVGIACQAMMQKKLSALEQSEVLSFLTVSVFDGLICCWNQKYTSDLVRPVTYIRAIIDSSWMPVLITPPFPEFSSGHSTISNAAATVLSRFLGDNFSFTDSITLKYNIQPQTFKSFSEAAAQASISRLYGGIHYRWSLDESCVVGRKIGEDVLLHLKTREQ